MADTADNREVRQGIGIASRGDTVRLGDNVLAFGRPQTMRFLYGPASGALVGGGVSPGVAGALAGAMIPTASESYGAATDRPSATGAEPALLVPGASQPTLAAGIAGNAYFDRSGGGLAGTAPGADRYFGGAGGAAMVAGAVDPALFAGAGAGHPDASGGGFGRIQGSGPGAAGSVFQAESVPGANIIPHLPDGAA